MVKIGWIDLGKTAKQATLDIQNKTLMSIDTDVSDNLFSISAYKNKIIAVGENGTIIEYDKIQNKFVKHSQSGVITTSDLRYIDISVGNGVVVGDNFTILDYNYSTNTFSAKSISGAANVLLLNAFVPRSVFGAYWDIYCGVDNDTKHGVIYIWDGTTLTKALDSSYLDSVGKATLYNIWSIDFVNVICVGRNGQLWKSTNFGQTWSKIETGVTDQFMACGGLSNDKVWIISLQGNIYQYNLNTDEFTLVKKTGAALLAIWMNDENDGYIVGAGGVMYHYDGVSWSRIPTGTAVALSSIFASEENKFYLCGNAGYVFFYYSKAYPSLIIDHEGNVVGIRTNPLAVSASGSLVKSEIIPRSEIKVSSVKPIPSTSGGVELSSGEVKNVVVKALTSNAGHIYVGGINNKPYSGYGYILAAGEKEEFNIDNLNKLYLFATTSGDKVSWYGLT